MTWYLLGTLGGLAIGAVACWPFAYRTGFYAADEYSCNSPCTAAHCADHPRQDWLAPAWTDPGWRRRPWTVLEALDRAASTWAAPLIGWLTAHERSSNWPPVDPEPDRMLWPTGEYRTVEQTADRHLQPAVDWDQFLAEISAQTLKAIEGR